MITANSNTWNDLRPCHFIQMYIFFFFGSCAFSLIVPFIVHLIFFSAVFKITKGNRLEQNITFMFYVALIICFRFDFMDVPKLHNLYKYQAVFEMYFSQFFSLQYGSFCTNSIRFDYRFINIYICSKMFYWIVLEYAKNGLRIDVCCCT